MKTTFFLTSSFRPSFFSPLLPPTFLFLLVSLRLFFLKNDSTDCPGVHYIAQVGLALITALLLQPPRCWVTGVRLDAWYPGAACDRWTGVRHHAWYPDSAG